MLLKVMYAIRNGHHITGYEEVHTTYMTEEQFLAIQDNPAFLLVSVRKA